MPICQEPTLVIREDQIFKLRLATRSHAIDTCQPTPSPTVFITGSSRGLSIGTTDPLSQDRPSKSYLVTDNVAAARLAQPVPSSLPKSIRGLPARAAVTPSAILRTTLLRAVVALGILLKALGKGVATFIHAADAIMDIVHEYGVLPFTSFFILSFSVGALRLYQSGQTIELDQPFMVFIVYVGYKFSAIAMNLASKLAEQAGYRRLSE